MRKLKIAILAVITAVILIAIIGFSIFKFYIVPNYVEPVLENVAEIVNNKNTQEEISETAKELAGKGLLDEEKVNQYIAEAEKSFNEDNTGNTDNSQSNTDEIFEEKNSIGAKNVKIKDEKSIGSKYTYGKSEPKNNVERSETAEDKQASSSKSESALFDKVKANVSAGDMTKAYALMSKLDLGTIRSLMSDRSALKKYMKASLSDEEYSEMIDLYLKYSYLLK